MGFDSNKDKLLKVFEYEYETGSLLIAVMSYDGGAPKVQMTRMYKKKNDEVGYGKLGRMSSEELQFLLDNIDEILKYMKGG